MIRAGMCTSFLAELARGIHNFEQGVGDVFAFALFTADANLTEDTREYSPINEVEGAGYAPGGFVFTPDQLVTPRVQGAVSYWSFSVDPEWPDSTIEGARAALIYNKSKGNRAVTVIDFGTDQSSRAARFRYRFPANGPATSIMRLQLKD
jgi:hypothetical protein